MIPSWAGRYVGLEYEDRGRGPKHDCWSLIRTVYQEQFGLNLPSYAESYATATDAEEIGQLVRGEAQTIWHSIPLREAQEGDVLVLRIKGQPCHCAVVVMPPLFLHIHQGINAALERWDSLKWRDRISGLYRHEELAARPEAVRG